MSGPVRIGNTHGFWGDRLDAAAEMLARESDLDFLTLDFLAEVSMSILAMQHSKDPDAGWPKDILEVVRSLAPYWQSGGRCRLITNAGGLNPVACARACQQVLAEVGVTDRTIVAVTGDDVLDSVRNDDGEATWLRNLDTGEPLTRVRDRLVTANAYIGAESVAQALALGADIVIAGRVADPSLTVAACAHHLGWSWNDWNRLAGATVAGHVIECGTQVTGGISTDWLQLPDADEMGFPIVEVFDDGHFIVTKPQGTGGLVSEQTVKEQLVYEIGDPGNYLSPDVTVSFRSLLVTQDGQNRVRVEGAAGRPAPATYKVSATYRDGFRASGQLTIFGADAVAKARRAGECALSRLARHGVTFRESLVECVGAGACRPWNSNERSDQLDEVVLRVSVADDSRENVTRFTREVMPLITAGPPGTTGYADGRPTVHPVFRYWPCLIARDRVQPRCEVVATGSGKQASAAPAAFRSSVAQQTDVAENVQRREQKSVARTLRDIAWARSGDKGINANVGVIARQPEFYAELCGWLTPARVAEHFGLGDARLVERFEWPNLNALNFVLHGILANPLRVDAQGKTLAQALLEMPLPLA